MRSESDRTEVRAFQEGVGLTVPMERRMHSRVGLPSFLFINFPIGQQQGNCKVQNLTLICVESLFPHGLHLPLYLCISQNRKKCLLSCLIASCLQAVRTGAVVLAGPDQPVVSNPVSVPDHTCLLCEPAASRSGGVTWESLFGRQV